MTIILPIFDFPQGAKTSPRLMEWQTRQAVYAIHWSSFATFLHELFVHGSIRGQLHRRKERMIGLTTGPAQQSKTNPTDYTDCRNHPIPEMESIIHFLLSQFLLVRVVIVVDRPMPIQHFGIGLSVNQEQRDDE